MERPFKYIQIIEKIENETAFTVRKNHAKELEVVDAALDQILSGLTDFSALKQKPTDRLESARLFLATRSFNSLWNARQTLVRGYFQQALTLVRMAMEDNLVVDDAEIHPPTLDALLGDEGRIGRGQFTLGKMAERLGPQGKTVWDTKYGMVSEYATHPRTMSLRSLNSVSPDGQLILRPGGRYDDVEINTVLFCLSQEIVKVMKTVAQLTAPLGSDWVNRAMPAFKEVDSLWKKIDEQVATQIKEWDENPERE